MDTKEALVFTGVGVLGAVGIGYEAFAARLRQGPIEAKGLSLFAQPPLPYGFEVEGFDPKAILGRKGLRNLDRNTRLVLSCIALDLAQQLSEGSLQEEVGLAIGTTFGSFPSLADFTQTYIRDGFRALNPGHFPNLVINSPPSQGNIRFGLTASSATLSSGPTAGMDALIYAATRLQQGDEACVLCGASEELSASLCAAMKETRSLASGRSLHPFDQGSEGTLPGEGAALFLLESKAHARQRGASVFAELVSWASCYSGQWAGQAAPDAAGGAWVIREVLRDAKIDASALGMISTSASGDPIQDAAEADAIEEALGTSCASVPVMAYGASWGDAGAASSALQVAATLASLQDETLRGNPSITRQRGRVWLPQAPVTRRSPYALVLSMGHTGNTSAILLRASQPLE